MADLRYRALLIGNATFPRDPNGLPALDGPLTDIEVLRQALIDREVGLFAPEDVEALPDHDVQRLRERLDEFYSSAIRKDVLLLYYSGHGELDLHGNLYLCAHNTKLASLQSTALPTTSITAMIDSSAAATTIVVLDCCHSGAFKGGSLAIPVTGKGRYVLTSNRSTQLASAAAQPGQPSPFTGLLVRGLRYAAAESHLTVTELYKQVHGWMAAYGPLAPQLRIAGEGPVVIARRGDLPLPQPPPAELLIETQTTALPGAWHAQRVRTGGVACILRVGNGTKEHIVEYRAHLGHAAVVLLDGKRIYQGLRHLNCEFKLDRRGARARLDVYHDSGIQLWVDDRLIYPLCRAEPGSDGFLEHRAHIIRNALLTAKEKIFEAALFLKKARLQIVPYIPRSAERAMRGKARRGVSIDPVIGMLTVKDSSLKVRIGFTDRALHICSRDGSIVVPYDELLAATVTSDYHTVDIGDRRIDIPGYAGNEVAKMINMVKDALLYEEIGLGEPARVHPLSLVYIPAQDLLRLTVLGRRWGMTGVTAFLITAVQIASIERLGIWLFIGLFCGFFTSLLVGQIANNTQPSQKFLWSLVSIATYATVASAWITWLPDPGPSVWGPYTPPPRYGWSTRLGDVLTIAVGNSAAISALGTGARVAGTLLITAAVFLPIAAVLMVIRMTRFRRRYYRVQDR